MKSIINIFLLLIFSLISRQVLGQQNLVKEIFDRNCAEFNKTVFLQSKKLPITDKQINKYINENYSDSFPQKTYVVFNLALTPTDPICCRRMVIGDSTRIKLMDVYRLRNLVLKYSEFTKVNKPKYVVLIVESDKGKTKAFFKPEFD